MKYCERCNGAGKVTYHKIGSSITLGRECMACNGTGRDESKLNPNLDIPSAYLTHREKVLLKMALVHQLRRTMLRRNSNIKDLRLRSKYQNDLELIERMIDKLGVKAH